MPGVTLRLMTICCRTEVPAAVSGMPTYRRVALGFLIAQIGMPSLVQSASIAFSAPSRNARSVVKRPR